MSQSHASRTDENGRILLLLASVMFLSVGALAALSIDLAPLLGATLIGRIGVG